MVLFILDIIVSFKYLCTCYNVRLLKALLIFSSFRSGLPSTLLGKGSPELDSFRHRISSMKRSNGYLKVTLKRFSTE